ncbi:helix-turn-helix domain-containing protein [Actinomadura keratinilytica]|uniref:helix-turn-helix domain-containing protein n=2 Tax=Actinomadura keratinilytica TaxID=547461 RepID=UPI003CD06B35
MRQDQQQMPASPSSFAQAARKRLAEQLRQMRTDARISGREFARRAGWRSSSQVSMIEHGRRTITPDHIRLWCKICGGLCPRRWCTSPCRSEGVAS